MSLSVFTVSMEWYFHDCLQSLRHRTDKILKCWHTNWFPCFSKTVLQCLQWLWGCFHNALNVLSGRQIRWIRQPVLRRNVVVNICVQPGDCSLWCMRTSAILLKQSFTVAGKQLCYNLQLLLLVVDVTLVDRINQVSNERLWYFAHKIALNFQDCIKFP